MSNNKSSDSNFKQKYRIVLEISTILSLVIVAFLFYSFKAFENKANNFNKYEPPIIVFDTPLTKQNKPKPPPSCPQKPVEAEEDELIDDVTIGDTDIDFTNFNDEIIPPPDEPAEELEFFAVSEKPELIRQVQPKYPELAKRTGIEGTVVIKALIDTEGNIEKVILLKSIPMLDEAALTAAKQCKYKPGKQRDKFVKVWVSLPFKFSLRSRSM